MMGGETTIYDLRSRIAELELKRNELVAHIERVRTARHEVYPREGFGLADWINNVCGVIDDIPAISLARRDFIKQAEVLERFRSEYDLHCEVPDFILGDLEETANNLRQQANQLEANQ